MRTRIYIVEDHPVMRETLREFLTMDPDIELCGEVPDAESASLGLESAAPHVVLLDLSLPGRSGLELLTEIRARWGTPCVVLSGHREGSYVRQALAAGAKGYVLKGKPQDVPVALRTVLDGEVFLSEELRWKLPREPMTDVEAEAADG